MSRPKRSINWSKANYKDPDDHDGVMAVKADRQDPQMDADAAFVQARRHLFERIDKASAGAKIKICHAYREACRALESKYKSNMAETQHAFAKIRAAMTESGSKP